MYESKPLFEIINELIEGSVGVILPYALLFLVFSLACRFFYSLLVGRENTTSLLSDLCTRIWTKVLQPCFQYLNKTVFTPCFRYLKRKFIEYLES